VFTQDLTLRYYHSVFLLFLLRSLHVFQKCKFGSSVIVDGYFDNEAIYCETTSAYEVFAGRDISSNSTINVTVAVSLDGENFSFPPLYFLYYGTFSYTYPKNDTNLNFYLVPPTVNKLIPRSSLLSVGSFIQVRGTGFLDLPAIACIFGSQSMPATYINATMMTCTSPIVSISKRSDVLTVPLEITLNGQQATSDDNEFIFYGTFTLH
jgi:IPT/TIG domain